MFSPRLGGQAFGKQRWRAKRRVQRNIRNLPAAPRPGRVPSIRNPTPRQRRAARQMRQRGARRARGFAKSTQKSLRQQAQRTRERRRRARFGLVENVLGRRLGSPIAGLERERDRASLGVMRGLLEQPDAPRVPKIPTIKPANRREAVDYLKGAASVLRDYEGKSRRYVERGARDLAKFDAEQERKHRSFATKALEKATNPKTALQLGIMGASPGTSPRQSKQMAETLARTDLFKKGVFAGRAKALGALGAVGHFTGTPGRELAKALGMPKSTQLAFEIALDPTTYGTGGVGAGVKGGARAARAAKALERAGVHTGSVRRFTQLQGEAARTGDARKVADAMDELATGLQRGRYRGVNVRPKQRGLSPSQKVAAETQRTAAGAPEIALRAPGQQRRLAPGAAKQRQRKVVLPGRGSLTAAEQKAALPIREAMAPGLRLGVTGPTGARGRRMRALQARQREIGPVTLSPVELQLRLPSAVARRIRVPTTRRLLGSGKVAENLRASIRADVVASHAEDLRAVGEARQALRQGKGDPALERRVTARERELGEQIQEEIGDLTARDAFKLKRTESLEQIARRRSLSRVAHASVLAGQDLSRSTRGALARAVDQAFDPLRYEHSALRRRGRAKGKSAENFEAALSRVQLHMWAREAGGEQLVKLLPPLRTAAERTTHENLRKVYDAAIRQGRELDSIKGAIPEYAGMRVWERDEPLAVINRMMGRGGAPGKEREIPSIFEAASRGEVARNVERAFGIPRDEARHLADELMERSTSRFFSQKIARQLQRGEAVKLEELSPAELRAVHAWSEDDGRRVFNSQEGHVTLRDTPEAGDFTPLDDPAQSLEALKFDVFDTAALERAAVHAGDTGAEQTYANLRARLERSLNERGHADPNVNFQLAPDAISMHPALQQVVGRPVALERALESIHPELREIKNAEGQPVQITVGMDDNNSLATYYADEHHLTVNANYSNVTDTSPENIARLRSTLMHELGHAATLSSGKVFHGAAHESAIAPHVLREQTEATAAGRFRTDADAQRVIARGEAARREAVVREAGGEEVIQRFESMRNWAKAHYGQTVLAEAGKKVPALKLNTRERQVLAEISRMESQYEKYIGQRGYEYTLLSETSARYMELLAINPENFAKIVGAENARWMQDEILAVQTHMLRPPVERAKVWVDPSDGKVWYGPKRELGLRAPSREAQRERPKRGLPPQRDVGPTEWQNLSPRARRLLRAENTPPWGVSNASRPDPPRPGSIEQYTVPQPELAWWRPGSGAQIDAAVGERITEPIMAAGVRKLIMALRAADANLAARKPGTIQQLRHEVSQVSEGGWLGPEQALEQERVVEQFQRAHGLASDSDARYWDGHAKYDAGSNENPFDPEAGGRLPDTRSEQPKFPLIDPRESNFYRTNAQSRGAAFVAQWRSYDHAVGRSMHDEGLIQQRDRWYDPATRQEYVRPFNARPGDLDDYLPADRVWPTHTVQEMRNELTRMGEFDTFLEQGAKAAADHIFSNMRFFVTAPFPAYHIRNMISDALKSLQADTGVMFHPIVNARLAGAAFGRGLKGKVKVPGIGEMQMEDFLFFADTVGIRSSEHLADYGRLVGRGGEVDRAAAGKMLDSFRRGAVNFGSRREDVMRLMTFMQRMRRNGGDAADAAHYMIRHHFDYSDLTNTERRFIRNVFLFYTWYRKNIPLQFTELIRRPGFFTGVAHMYEASDEGRAPWSQDWSKLHPWLPDMTGEVPNIIGRPGYINDRLAALPLSWNDHAAYFGFGAPWADMSMVSVEGVKSMLAMLNPIIGVSYGLASRRDVLTGRRFREMEPSSIAALVDTLGFTVHHDKQGRPVLPWALNVALGLFPGAGRATSILGSSPANQAEGRSRLLKSLGPVVTGVTPWIYPKDDKGRIRSEMFRLAAEREQYFSDLSNLPDNERWRRAMVWNEENIGRAPRPVQLALARLLDRSKTRSPEEKLRRVMRQDRALPIFYRKRKKGEPAPQRGGGGPGGGGFSPGSSGGGFKPGS